MFPTVPTQNAIQRSITDSGTLNIVARSSLPIAMLPPGRLLYRVYFKPAVRPSRGSAATQVHLDPFEGHPMNQACRLLVFAFALFLSVPAVSQTIPKDTCSVLSQADLDAVLGPGAKATAIGEEQCEYKVGMAEYALAVRRSNGARELKDWVEFTMVKPVKPLAGVGDEAFVSSNGNAAAFRKGNVAVRVSSSGVFKQTPMTYQQGVVELSKRIAAKIK